MQKNVFLEVNSVKKRIFAYRNVTTWSEMNDWKSALEALDGDGDIVIRDDRWAHLPEMPRNEGCAQTK